MHSFFAGFAVVVAFAVGAAVAAEEKNELTENVITLEQLPARVADTLRFVLGNRRPGEIREIRCEGIPILYEVEYTEDRRKTEVVITPDGVRIPARSAKARGPVKERKIQENDLPAPVKAALVKRLGEGPFEEMNELRYRGLVVIYEVAGEVDELWFYPTGVLAREQKKAPDSEAAEDATDEPDPS